MASLPEGWPYTQPKQRRAKHTRAPWDKARKAALTSAWNAGDDVATIADVCYTSPGCIYRKARELGLPSRSPGRKRRVGAKKIPAYDHTGQRRFTGVDPDADAQPPLKAHHPAARDGSTRYGAWVTPAIEMKGMLLKSGVWNRKIGGTMEKGRWKGMPIYTLTLEERATCPRTCRQWLDCYGNNMGQTARLFDDGWLEMRLHVDLHQLSMEHPGGFIVRLHVLGDFYSVKYVDFWRNSLTIFPQLHIFGFTAWQPATDIGRAVLEMMAGALDQVAMRVSGGDLELHCSEVVERKEDARFIVCPAELDSERSCATCGFCPNSEKSLSFIRH